MSPLVQLIIEVLAGVLGGPPTNRGLLILFTIVGLALAVMGVWSTTNGIDVVRAPDWQIGILLASLLGGSAGLLVAVLHLRREPSERPLAGACLALNVVAVSTSIAALVR